MAVLTGKVLKISEISESSKAEMFRLMDEFYDNMRYDVFLRDFNEKDFVIVLFADEKIKGFTTQKLMKFDVDGMDINGIFSGDTIIHRDYWGSTELFKAFARFFFAYADNFDNFYWFLICKGYKTYRILPTFWKEFYPNRNTPTPLFEKKIIDRYAEILYPDEYNRESGVIEYKTVKDKLKSNVADIGEKELKNKDIAFFAEANPNHINGDDIACLAKIGMDELKPLAVKLLF